MPRRINPVALRALRRALGLSQAEAARRAGLSYAYYNQLENGGRPGSPAAIKAIAGALEESVLAFTEPVVEGAA